MTPEPASAAFQRHGGRLAAARARFPEVEPLGGCGLFQLAKARDADGLFERLARRGVLTRPYLEGGLIRFGLPGGAKDWSRLAAALSGANPQGARA